VNALEHAVAFRRVQVGDVLLIRNGERGWINAAIRFAQRRALADLRPSLPGPKVEEFAGYTHAAQLISLVCLAEQYAPKARCRRLAALPPGAHVLVRRLRGACPARVEPIVCKWAVVVTRADPYPVRELLYYWFRWARKTWAAKKFAEVFKDRRHNVCSGQVVECSRAGGWFAGEPNEAWYPARLAEDIVELETVAEFDIEEYPS
jgi:hypothetical protein